MIKIDVKDDHREEGVSGFVWLHQSRVIRGFKELVLSKNEASCLR